jgi:predicted outer membrane repeat protein
MGRSASSLTLVGNIISGNESVVGAGLDLDDSAGTLFNNLITGNTAGGSGGAIFIKQWYLEMTNCTVTGNSANNGGAIACQNATVEASNSILRDNTPNEICTLTGESPDIDHSNVQGGYVGPRNIDADPLFVADGDFGYCLSQVDAGQPADSPCVNAGDGPGSTTCITLPDGDLCMDALSTRTDGVYDAGVVDMGFHRLGFGPNPVTAGLGCWPVSGTLPFNGTMLVTLGSGSDSQKRRVAGRIDVELAGGGSIVTWRAGWTNLSPGEVFSTNWNQPFPAMPSLVGENLFRLTAEDVTPPPYNQPPYPPAGGTDTAACTVTGLSP